MAFEQRFKEPGRLIQDNNDKIGEKCLYFGILQGKSMRFVDKQIEDMGKGIKDTLKLFGPSNYKNYHHLFNKKSVVKSRYRKKIEFMHISF